MQQNHLTNAIDSGKIIYTSVHRLVIRSTMALSSNARQPRRILITLTEPLTACSPGGLALSTGEVTSPPVAD
jgi:hypothetical protein